jgi:TolB-like protein
MSDVFISYARSTAREARAAAETLRTLGYSVWLDEDLPANRAFTLAIEEELTKAKAALVIWSADAAKSEWVLSEANRARETHKLVQLRIDGANLPMPFDQIQCVDLSGWSGGGEHPAWRKVAASVADLVRRTESAAPQRVLASASSEPLLAVLAFDNLSGDPEMAYFSDGISEEILDTVGRSSGLKVIARSSSFQFRGADKAVKKVVAELKATHILDGSVRRSGPHVRIAARLVDCASETTNWSERYDRDLTDIFALQDEIAAAVAAALKTALAQSPPPAPIDPAAFDLFLRAQAYSAVGIEGFNRRLTMLEEAVGRAPEFARGWATLAYYRAVTLRHNRAEANAVGLRRDQVVEAAETALRLDPHMGLAYQALRWLEPFAAYRARKALNDKALAAAPNDAEVLAQTVSSCSAVGRLEEALAFARRAYELDPLEALVTNALGVHLTFANRIDEAGDVFDAALARWPEHAVLAANGMQSAALRKDRAKVEGLIRAWSAAAATGNAMLQNAIWYASNLIEPDTQSITRSLGNWRDELARTGTVPLFAPWRLHRLGLTEEAFELLDKASFAHMFDPEGPPPSGFWPAWFAAASIPGLIFSRNNEPFFRDPRFPRLCAKLGLCDYWIETDKWPDCADDVPYDLRTEARRLAGRTA